MAIERIGVGNPGVAVVGAGAWGRNLVRNFNELGALSAICDSSEAVARRQREGLSAGLGSPEATRRCSPIPISRR